MAGNVFAWDLFVSRLPDEGERFGDYTLYHEAVDRHTGHNILQVNTAEDEASLFLVPGNPAVPGYTHTLYVYTGCPDEDGVIVYSDIMVWGDLDVGTPVYASFWEKLVCRIPAMVYYPDGKAGLTASTYNRYLRNIDWSFAAYCPILVPDYDPDEDDEVVGEGELETINRYHLWRPEYGTACSGANLDYALENRPWQFSTDEPNSNWFTNYVSFNDDNTIRYYDKYRCDPLPEVVYRDEWYYWTLEPGAECTVEGLEAAIEDNQGITDAPDNTESEHTFSETEEGAGPDGDQTVVTFSHYKCVFTAFDEDDPPPPAAGCSVNQYIYLYKRWFVDPDTVCDNMTYEWFVANKPEDITTYSTPPSEPATFQSSGQVVSDSGVTCYNINLYVWCVPRVKTATDSKPGGQWPNQNARTWFEEQQAAWKRRLEKANREASRILQDIEPAIEAFSAGLGSVMTTIEEDLLDDKVREGQRGLAEVTGLGNAISKLNTLLEDLDKARKGAAIPDLPGLRPLDFVFDNAKRLARRMKDIAEGRVLLVPVPTETGVPPWIGKLAFTAALVDWMSEAAQWRQALLVPPVTSEEMEEKERKTDILKNRLTRVVEPTGPGKPPPTTDRLWLPFLITLFGGDVSRETFVGGVLFSGGCLTWYTRQGREYHYCKEE